MGATISAGFIALIVYVCNIVKRNAQASSWLWVGLPVLVVIVLVAALTWQAFGRLVSALGRWIINNWQLVVGLPLLAGVAYGASELTNEPWAAILPLGLALATTLLARYRPILRRKQRSMSLQAWNGNYVCAESGGGRELIANRDNRSRWETFQLIELGNSKVALKAWNGQYVRAEKGSGRLIADRNRIGERETFELIELGDDRVAFRAHNGRYVCAENAASGYEVAANRDGIGEWETFALVEP